MRHDALLLALTLSCGVASAQTPGSGTPLASLPDTSSTMVIPTLRVEAIPSTPLAPDAAPLVAPVKVAPAVPDPVVPVVPAGPVVAPPVVPAVRATPAPAPTPSRAPAVPLLRAMDPLRGPRVWAATPVVTHTAQSRAGVVRAASFGISLPSKVFLGGLGFAFQTHNNCGPAAVSSALAYFGVRVGQADLRKVLRPKGGYMSASVIAPYVRKFGLRARVVRNASLPAVKRLLAQGVPVIVLQWLDRPGHIPHFRVVRGFDDAAGLVWVSDSMVGSVSYLSYRDFGTLWNTQGRLMIPVYPATSEGTLAPLLGPS